MSLMKKLEPVPAGYHYYVTVQAVGPPTAWLSVNWLCICYIMHQLDTQSCNLCIAGQPIAR